MHTSFGLAVSRRVAGRHIQNVRVAAPRQRLQVARQTRSYHDRVIDHYENPRNVGSFAKTDSDVGTGLVGAPACGDVMKLQLKISPEGVVLDAKFKTFGCGSAIASSSLATEMVKGKTIDECLQIKNTEIAKHLALPPVKLHCSMLAEDAIRAAIADYKRRHTSSDAQAQAAHVAAAAAAAGQAREATASH